MILYDFQCIECEHVFEELTKMDKLVETCPECTGTATRLISAPKITLDGCSGDFPGAALKWEKIRRHHHTKGSKSEDL